MEGKERRGHNIIKHMFSGKGKAFNIVNKHKKKSGRNTWAYSVWTELRMGFDAEGVHDRKELQLKYREACKFKERINPVDQITEVETWVYKLRQCGVKIDEDTIIYDILGGLPDCYDIVGQSIEEAMEDESTKPTLSKVEGLLKKRWQWLKKQNAGAGKIRDKLKKMQDGRKKGGGAGTGDKNKVNGH